MSVKNDALGRSILRKFFCGRENFQLCTSAPAKNTMISCPCTKTLFWFWAEANSATRQNRMFYYTNKRCLFNLKHFLKKKSILKAMGIRNIGRILTLFRWRKGGGVVKYTPFGKKMKFTKIYLNCRLGWNFHWTKFSFEHFLKIWAYFVNPIKNYDWLFCHQ